MIARISPCHATAVQFARRPSTKACAIWGLRCSAELEQVRTILRRGASYQRQRAVARRNAGDLGAVVRALVEEFKAGRPL